MASSSFAQKCPTCETMVLIKDATQVGKKMECPKCKDRFVVEASVKPPDRAIDDGDNLPPRCRTSLPERRIGDGGEQESAIQWKAAVAWAVTVFTALVIVRWLFFSGSSVDRTRTEELVRLKAEQVVDKQKILDLQAERDQLRVIERLFNVAEKLKEILEPKKVQPETVIETDIITGGWIDSSLAPKKK